MFKYLQYPTSCIGCSDWGPLGGINLLCVLYHLHWCFFANIIITTETRLRGEWRWKSNILSIEALCSNVNKCSHCKIQRRHVFFHLIGIEHTFHPVIGQKDKGSDRCDQTLCSAALRFNFHPAPAHKSSVRTNGTAVAEWLQLRCFKMAFRIDSAIYTPFAFQRGVQIRFDF